MSNPITPVTITRIIQSTELSIFRALASRATHANKTIFSTKMIIGMIIMTPLQAAHAAQLSGSPPRCASARLSKHNRLSKPSPARFSLLIFVSLS